MSELRVEWDNSVAGYLRITAPEHRVIETLAELLAFLKENRLPLRPEMLKFFGALAFFMAIREFGRGSQFVLEGAEKAFDSFYPVLSDEVADAQFQAGIEGLQEYLFPVRSEAYPELLLSAYDYVQAGIKM